MTTYLLFLAVVGVILLLAVMACWQWWVAVSLREELVVARRQLMEQLDAAKALREHGIEGWNQSSMWSQVAQSAVRERDDAVSAERIASQALVARDVELGEVQTAMMKVGEEFEKIKVQHEALQKNAVASSERYHEALGAWIKWAVMELGRRFEGYDNEGLRKAISAELQEARSASFQAQGGEVVSRSLKRLVRLVVRQRGGDFHVQLESDATQWDCGLTAHDAIARWIVTHGKEYGIEVTESNAKHSDAADPALPPATCSACLGESERIRAALVQIYEMTGFDYATMPEWGREKSHQLTREIATEALWPSTKNENTK